MELESARARGWALAASALACAALACAGASAAGGSAARGPTVSQGFAPADAPAPPSCGEPAEGASPVALRWPANGRVTSGFGGRNGRPHEGIDIAGYPGAIVRAAADGTVTFSGRKPSYGRVVILAHGEGVETVYAHNTDNFVIAGARVKQGEGIADMGSTGRTTGPHLHFEVRVDRRPVDPLTCLPSRTTTRR